MTFSGRAGHLATNAFMLIIGVILSLPAAHRIYVYWAFRTAAVPVWGSVDKPAAGADFGGRPLVRYLDLEGEEHIFKSRVKTHIIQAPRQGEQIRVLFQREDPRNAMVDSRLHFLILPILFVTVGAAVIYRAVKNCLEIIRVTG